MSIKKMVDSEFRIECWHVLNTIGIYLSNDPDIKFDVLTKIGIDWWGMLSLVGRFHKSELAKYMYNKKIIGGILFRRPSLPMVSACSSVSRSWWRVLFGVAVLAARALWKGEIVIIVPGIPMGRHKGPQHRWHDRFRQDVFAHAAQDCFSLPWQSS